MSPSTGTDASLGTSISAYTEVERLIQGGGLCVMRIYV